MLIDEYYNTFVSYNFPNAWCLTSLPIFSVNWGASKSDKWIVPFGGGFGKIFTIGDQKNNAFPST